MITKHTYEIMSSIWITTVILYDSFSVSGYPKTVDSLLLGPLRERRQISQNYGSGSNAINLNCNGPNGCLPNLDGIIGGSGLGNILGSVLGGALHPNQGGFNNQVWPSFMYSAPASTIFAGMVV